jgi:SAM-dependent methyltransferase
MDEATLRAYDANARAYGEDWLAQPPPADMYALFRRFLASGPTIDVGCGNGRDVDWLNRNGWPSVGVDASEGLLRMARVSFPLWPFRRAALPELAGIGSGHFANVVCETVVMHLPSGVIADAVAGLDRVLRPGGVLYLSWRVTEGGDVRDARGRLYSAFAPDAVLGELSRYRELHREDVISESSGKRVCRFIGRKPG